MKSLASILRRSILRSKLLASALHSIVTMKVMTVNLMAETVRARFSRFLVLHGIALLLTAACATTQPDTRRAERPTGSAEGGISGETARVECLLPSQIRRLGTNVYLAPRRAIVTSQGDCEIRGGTVTSPLS